MLAPSIQIMVCIYIQYISIKLLFQSTEADGGIMNIVANFVAVMVIAEIDNYTGDFLAVLLGGIKGYSVSNYMEEKIGGFYGDTHLDSRIMSPAKRKFGMISVLIIMSICPVIMIIYWILIKYT
jgi:hypothetical protein